MYSFMSSYLRSFIRMCIYIYDYICLQSVRIPSCTLKGGRRHQGVSPFIRRYTPNFYGYAIGPSLLSKRKAPELALGRLEVQSQPNVFRKP